MPYLRNLFLLFVDAPSVVVGFVFGTCFVLYVGGASFVDHLCYFCLVLLCFHARLVVTCWERADLLALVCYV